MHVDNRKRPWFRASSRANGITFVLLGLALVSTSCSIFNFGEIEVEGAARFCLARNFEDGAVHVSNSDPAKLILLVANGEPLSEIQTCVETAQFLIETDLSLSDDEFWDVLTAASTHVEEDLLPTVAEFEWPRFCDLANDRNADQLGSAGSELLTRCEQTQPAVAYSARRRAT